MPEQGPNAPATSMDRCTSGLERERGRVEAQRAKKGAEEAHTAQQPHRQKRGGGGGTTKETTEHKDRAANKGGGAGKAEEDRAEKATHVTLE